MFVLPEAIRNALGLPLLNGVTSFDQAGRVSRWVQDTESWAVFFQGEYQLTDSLTLTAGVRYTEEEKRAVASTRITTDTTGLATPNGSPLLAAIFRGVTPNTYDHDYDDTRKTDQVTPAVSLEWSQSDDNLYYASYSEGFKSGGFNSVDDQAPDLSVDPVAGVYTTPGDGWRYEDETAKSLEIGGKHTLLDGSMTFNWALFASQYDNQQVSTFVGTGFVVANAASSDVNGLEVDLLWQATDNLKLGANVALLDASYGDFPSAGCTALQDSATNIRFANSVESFDGCVRTLGADGNYIANQNLAGQSLKHSPEYSGALSADYSRSVGKGDMQWYMNVDVNFTDSYLLTGDLDPLDSQEGFEKINVRTGLRGENWDVMLYGKNITDEITASGGFDVPLAAGSHAIYTDSGEIYGVRVSFNF